MQAIGRSRGGLTSKIHVAVDALGNPIRWILTGGEVHDSTQGIALIEGFNAQAVLADKGYDSNEFVSYIQEHQMQVVIPPKSNRIEIRHYDKHQYKERNLVERFFSRIKHFRRIATRYEKLDRNFISFINLACAIIWMT